MSERTEDQLSPEQPVTADVLARALDRQAAQIREEIKHGDQLLQQQLQGHVASHQREHEHVEASVAGVQALLLEVRGEVRMELAAIRTSTEQVVTGLAAREAKLEAHQQRQQGQVQALKFLPTMAQAVVTALIVAGLMAVLFNR